MSISIRKGDFKYLDDCAEILKGSELGMTYFTNRDNEYIGKLLLKEGFENKEIYVAFDSSKRRITRSRYWKAMYGNYQRNKIPGLSFKDCLNYMLKGKHNAFITVGIIKDGKATYTVYGKDGAEMPKTEHIYEIGSLTKTFTAALMEKVIIEGKINLDDTTGKYLDMPVGNTYPTIE